MKYLISILLLGAFSQYVNSQISGKVTDAETGKNLTGAHVVLYYEDGISQADHAVTDRSGEFVFPGFDNTTLSISVSHLGYKIYRSKIEDNKPVYMEISLEPVVVPVGEVTVNAVRREKNLINVSMPVSILNSREMEQMAGITPAAIMDNEPGISMARDGIWATSLNIRGLTEQRIVTLVDGNRIETANDVAAGMAMIDINDIERIEVIKGAASSLYGTGALGGVVNIITKQGHYSNKFYAAGDVSGLYQSVNNMHSEHAALGIGNRRWYLRLSGTYRDAQNVMTPAGELENSQFTDNNFSVKMGIKPYDKHEFKLNYQRFYAKDVGIPGGDAFPAGATATYPEELRDMFSASYRVYTTGEIFRDLEIKYYHQYILRDVLLQPNPAVRITPSGYHTTNGMQFLTSLSLPAGHSAIAGIDLWQRTLETEREKNINKPLFDSAGNKIGINNIIIGEVPIPESKYTSAGIFFNDEFKTFNDKLTVVAGGRFDLINVINEQAVDPLYMIMNGNRNDAPAGQRITFENRDVYNYSWSANLGLILDIAKDMDLTANLSRAFRSPSIEERYKYIDLDTIVSIGDPELDPEDGYFADVGVRVWKENLHVSVNGFVNSLKNLIVAQPGIMVYNRRFEPEISDTVKAFINSNVDRALLYGLDLSYSYNFWGRLSFFGSASYVRGIDVNNDADLPSIPPLNGRIGFRYDGLKWIRTELAAIFFAGQERIAEGETPTTGYSYYDFRISTKPVDAGFAELSLFAGVENFTDRGYINHMASNRGIVRYEPGRNFYIRLKASF